MEQVSREQAAEIAAELKAAAAEIFSRHGLQMSPRARIGFGDLMSVKLEAIRVEQPKAAAKA